MFSQPGKPDCGIDVISQEFLAERHLTGEKAFQCRAQKPLSIGRVAPRPRLNCFSEISCQSHFLFPFFTLNPSPPVVFPSVDRKPDVLLLALFRSPTDENDHPFVFFPEIYGVSGPEI